HFCSQSISWTRLISKTSCPLLDSPKTVMLFQMAQTLSIVFGVKAIRKPSSPPPLEPLEKELAGVDENFTLSLNLKVELVKMNKMVGYFIPCTSRDMPKKQHPALPAPTSPSKIAGPSKPKDLPKGLNPDAIKSIVDSND